MSAVSLIVLQNYFEPRSEERYSRIKSQQRILIHKTGLSNSNVARFCRRSGMAASFATQSTLSGRPSQPALARFVSTVFVDRFPLSRFLPGLLLARIATIRGRDSLGVRVVRTEDRGFDR